MDNSRPPIRIPKKSKIAFVCSGGGTKAGAFHLGVALALQEKGFKFAGGLKPEKELRGVGTPAEADTAGREISTYVGSSAGSIISSYLASGYSLEQIFDSFMGRKTKGSPDDPPVLKRLNYATMFSLRKDIGLLDTLRVFAEGAKLPSLGRFVQRVAKDSYENLFKWSWLKWSGLFSTAGVERYMREHVLKTNDFRDYKADLFIVATQLNHSKKVVFGKYKYLPADKSVIYRDDVQVSEACAASIALPLVFAPFPIKNERGQTVYYFDGEIRDTLSTHVAFDSGCDLIFASYTHQPYHFTKEIGSLQQYGMPAIAIQALYLLIEGKIKTAMERHERHASVFDSVSTFFKENNLSDDLRLKCLDMLEHKLGFRRNVDYIYIHPKPTDHQMFFGDHFNLSKKKLSEIVRLGYRTATDYLRQYEFS